MGSFLGGSKVPAGPSPEQIRKEELASIRKENLALQSQQEEARGKLRGRLLKDDDEDTVKRKKLLGE